MGVLAEGVWWFGVEGIRGQRAEVRGQSDKVFGGCGVLGGFGMGCWMGGGSWEVRLGTSDVRLQTSDFRFQVSGLGCGLWGVLVAVGGYGFPRVVSVKECGVFIANGDLGAVLRGFSYRMKGVLCYAEDTLADGQPVAPGVSHQESPRMKITQITITIVALIIAAVHLKCPDLKIDLITLTLLLVAVVPWLAPIFKSLELPGGWKIEFQELQKAKERADEVGLLSGEVQSAVSYSFQLVADNDPNLALAGLRIEIEKRLNQIAESYQIDTGRSSTGRLLRLLGKRNLLSHQEQSVLADMMDLLNGAVHGAQIDSRAADWAMDVGPRLLASLDEKIKQS